MIRTKSKLLLVVCSILWPVTGPASTRVVAWGAGTFSANTPNYGQCMVPSDLTNAIAIAEGYVHSLALTADGKVVAWGFNSFEDHGQSTVPAGLSNVVAIAAGGHHTLAIVGEGPPGLRAPMANPTVGAGGFSVSVPSQSGRVYALEFKNQLTDDAWTASPLVAGTGGWLALRDSTTTTAQRFYRVRQW